MGPTAASVAAAAPVATTPVLSVSFAGDSWVEITGRDGEVLEKGLLGSGTKRNFDLSRVGSVVLGNAAAVTVERNGQPVELDAFRRANVARFTVSSDGSLAPVHD